MKISPSMLKALRFMAGNGGTSIGPGCPSTHETFAALSRRGLTVWCDRYWEITEAGRQFLAQQ